MQHSKLLPHCVGAIKKWVRRPQGMRGAAGREGGAGRLVVAVVAVVVMW